MGRGEVEIVFVRLSVGLASRSGVLSHCRCCSCFAIVVVVVVADGVLSSQ